MDKLKKCPFCGGIARPENNEDMKWLASVPTNYWVRCICCGCETAICDEPEQAAEKWQARVGGLAKINLDTIYVNKTRIIETTKVKQNWTAAVIGTLSGFVAGAIVGLTR